MGDFNPQNILDLKTEDVESQVRALFENEAPLYNLFDKMDKSDVTEKGKRIAYYSRRPGGHTAYNPLASDFNVPIEPQTISMYVYPTYYALPMIINETTLGLNPNLESMLNVMKQWPAAATKRINRMYHGDGTGALAFSSSTISSTGAGQTMNCTTTAAATPGQTKGAVYLEPGHIYQAWNTTSNAARGTFSVETAGRSSCVINLTSGTITSGDPIVDVGSYSKWFRGLGHGISGTSRLLQGLNTANFSDLNSAELDLNGTTLTPAALHTIKGQLNVRANDGGAESGLTCVIGEGQFRQLSAQNYSFRQYIMNAAGGDKTVGVANMYEDHDTKFLRDADADDDRLYLWKNGTIKNFEQFSFGEKNLDGQQWRMLLGANNSGSGRYQKAWGCSANLAFLFPRHTALIKRAGLTNVVTQVSA
jgi:hypothetical protein